MVKNSDHRSGYGYGLPPPLVLLRIYMDEKGFSGKETELFLLAMQKSGWRGKAGRPIPNWKQYLSHWRNTLQHVNKMPSKTDKNKNNRHAK